MEFAPLFVTWLINHAVKILIITTLTPWSRAPVESTAITAIVTPPVHSRIHTSLPLVPIPIHINLHLTTTSHSKIHLNVSTQLCLGLPSGLLPSCFPTKLLYAFYFSATEPSQLTLCMI
jgi:hypothetical protein